MIGQDKQEQQQHSDFQEHCENSRKKYQTSNRILKHHDLDRLLVYGKRNINPTQSNQQYTEKNSTKTPKKFVEALKSKRNSKNIKNYKNKNISLKFTQQNELIQNKNIQNDLKQIQKQAQPIEQVKLEHDKTKQQISSKNNEIDQNLNLSSINIKQQKKRNLLKLHKKNSYLKKSITALSESQSDDNGYKFPFMNHYLDKHSDQYLSTMEAIDEVRENINSQTGTFINCDVRYFNWSMFIESTGKFDVMIIDPPWRIKGAQQNDSQFMFSNCKFSLEYNTMANSQISRIPLHMVIEEGFIFLWILNSQLNSSLQIMQNWGFELIDELVWVKLRDQKVYLTHGYYFMHSYEICLIGYKSNHKKPARLKKYISNNTIFAEVQKKSQKPSDLYYIIEMIFKGKKKIEIFARNNNLRFGIFSLGNQLGQSYDKWKVSTQCDHCEKVINFGHKRYKSKHEANYDVCQSCADNLQKQYFFQLFNQVDQDIRHQYVLCNGCKAQPIWGIRFQCITCYDFDLCQLCFDKNLSTQTIDKFHPVEHEYRTIEVPVFGNGFNIHQYKCASCYTNPITGICYNCLTCKNYKLCQKCFFQKSKVQLAHGSRSHKQNHQMQAIFEPQLLKSKKYQCFQCKKQILEHCWMCQNCYNFFFCQQCYNERQNFKSFYANSHKKYHIYTHIF